MDTSPLNYLDIDVSRYLYENYCPQEIDIFNKKLLIEQFKYFMNFDVYPDFYIGAPIPCGHTGGEPTYAIYNHKLKNFKINKHDTYSYKLFLKYIKEHYIIKMKDNIITYNIRYY